MNLEKYSLAGAALVFAMVSGTTFAAQASPLRISFVGDIMLDGGPGHLVTNSVDPFAHVAPWLLGSDVTVGNLECAITRQGHAEDKPYTFKGPIASLPILKRYFSALSLANNHAADWGTAGFVDELALLRDNRIAFFGGGTNEVEARRPLVMSVNGRRIALLGYNEFPPKSFAATRKKAGTAWLIESNIVADIRQVRTMQSPDLVLLYLHWGEELEPLPTKAQEELARRLIDAGADAIIGSHPHVTQTIEWYHERPIVYSLGNFVFDYFPTDPPTWTSYILRLDYEASPTPKLSTIPLELDAAGIPHVVPVSRGGIATTR
jgi:poly-gamma-glutamate capsule biosynthesis protein CapA/YwtB (metallophosphatase superfamily)